MWRLKVLKWPRFNEHVLLCVEDNADSLDTRA